MRYGNLELLVKDGVIKQQKSQFESL